MKNYHQVTPPTFEFLIFKYIKSTFGIPSPCSHLPGHLHNNLLYSLLQFGRHRFFFFFSPAGLLNETYPPTFIMIYDMASGKDPHHPLLLEPPKIYCLPPLIPGREIEGSQPEEYLSKQGTSWVKSKPELPLIPIRKILPLLAIHVSSWRKAFLKLPTPGYWAQSFDLPIHSTSRRKKRF